jgi:hypothetical protein
MCFLKGDSRSAVRFEKGVYPRTETYDGVHKRLEQAHIVLSDLLPWGIYPNSRTCPVSLGINVACTEEVWEKYKPMNKQKNFLPPSEDDPLQKSNLHLSFDRHSVASL